MQGTEKSLKAALDDITRLENAAAKWAAQETNKAAELETFEASASARLVSEPEAAETLTNEAARLRAGLALTKRTIAAAEQQLADAHRQVLISRAAELRTQAKNLQAEAAKRQPKTDAMLAELRAWENCAYVPISESGDSGMISAGYRNLSRTERMRNQAMHFEKQAAELEQFAAGSTPAQIAAKSGQLRAQASAERTPAA